MKILVISSNYPSEREPNSGAFVYNLMQKMSDVNNITIIAPFKKHTLFKKKKGTYGRENCKILRPKYFSFSNRKLGGIDTGKWSESNFKKAVLSAIKKLSEKPDIIYAHFIRNAIPVLEYAEENNVPIVVASGESTYDHLKKRTVNVQTQLKQQIKHIICVSRENKYQLQDLGFDISKMSVIPNAVNYKLFRPIDKKVCKEKLNIKKNKFVVGFIGHFIHRKGPNRIIKAIDQLNDKDIELICVGGKGNLEENNFTKALAPVANFELPEIYNAFDVFVLPTLHEGSCNVIEEAKACGIPIISSKGTSVEEQIDESIGILVNPLNVEEIANAIKKIKNNNELRDRMIENLLKKRGENSIENRAKKISLIMKKAL